MTASLVTYRNAFAEIRPLVETLADEPALARLTVIDNASDPALAAALAPYAPKVVYRASANIGFGAAHNLAIREALAENGDYHFVINPDIRLGKGTLGRLAAFFEAHPSVGLVMPKTLNPDGSLQRNCKLLPRPIDLFGRYFLPKRLNRRRNERFTLAAFDLSAPREIPYLCGCFLGLRLAALRAVGLFDERFFMYPEDIDLTRRMWSAGWHPTFVPDVSVVHAHAAGSYHSFRLFLVHCVNLMRYFNKWGWFFDSERTRINEETLRRLKGEA